MILCGLCNARGNKYKRNNASFVSPIAWPLKTTDISSKTTDISEKMTDISSKTRDIFSPYSERKKEKMKEWRVEKE